MASQILVVTNTTWTMIYDASVSGDFVGVVSAMTGPLFLRVGTVPPLPNDGGFKLDTSSQINLSKVAGDKLYVRSVVGSAALQIDTNLSANLLPVGLFKGHAAMTTQDYIEANVKNGLQYEWAQRFDLAAAGSAGDRVSCVLTTTTKKALIKARIIGFTGLEIQARLYAGSTFTGGAAGAVYNLRPSDGIATTVSIKEGVTVSVLGTESGAPTFGLGGAGPGQTVVGTFAVRGVERVLNQGANALLQIRNFDTAACKITVYVTWYEGEPDLSPTT